MQQNNLFINDMILSPNLIDTNIGLSSLSKDDFDSVKISGKYTMVNYKKEIPYSYISLDRGQITKDYYTAQNFSGETLDMPITLKAYSQNTVSYTHLRASISGKGTTLSGPADRNSNAFYCEFYVFNSNKVI